MGGDRAVTTVRVADIERAVARAFPPEWAEDWDRVGLLAGDPDREVTGVVCALDPTRDAIAQTVARGANVLVTHHPAFLSPPAWLTPGRGAAGVLFAALDAGVALVNAHTNLDRAPAAGALLPSALGLAPVKPIERSTMPVTLVTVFVPATHAEKVVSAMAGAGAGRIGDYEKCRFTSAEGTGAFEPLRGTTPAVGTPEADSSSTEVRVEMVAPRTKARGVVSAARGAHPYEEPLIVAADVEIARSTARMGMLCEAPDGLTVRDLAVLAGGAFNVTPRVWGDPETPVPRVATATGSAGSLVGDVLASGAQALVAGEVRYHDALDAMGAGLAIVEIGHDVSEWPLVDLLVEAVSSVEGLPAEAIVQLSASYGWWTP
jgi:putative NIF3 family GTP cyclohydrolase 1 type 2